jgi:hypothetical protein
MPVGVGHAHCVADGHAVSHHATLDSLRGKTVTISYPSVAETDPSWIKEFDVPAKWQ